MVIRYVATHINRDGMRTLSQGAQGRYTYATREEAQDYIEKVFIANSAKLISQIWGEQAIGTFEVRECDCWPVHFDPKGVWFD